MSDVERPRSEQRRDDEFFGEMGQRLSNWVVTLKPTPVTLSEADLSDFFSEYLCGPFVDFLKTKGIWLKS